MSNCPFSRFGIKHLSPSSLNLFAANAPLWAGKYMFGWTDDAGPAAKRGTAVEAGLDVFLWERNPEKAMGAALDNFALNTHGIAEADYEKERDLIVPMLKHAMAMLKDTPTPLARQIKVECWFDSVSVPIVGYVDYEWPDKIRDLKTTLRIPSELKGDHARQVSLYWKKKGKPTSILYVSDKRASEVELNPDEALRHLHDMRRHAEALQHALSRASNRYDFVRCYPVDFDNFRWSDQTKKLCRDMYAPL